MTENSGELWELPAPRYEAETLHRVLAYVRNRKVLKTAVYSYLEPTSKGRAETLLHTKPPVYTHPVDFKQKVFVVWCGPKFPRHVWVTNYRNLEVMKAICYEAEIATKFYPIRRQVRFTSIPVLVYLPIPGGEGVWLRGAIPDGNPYSITFFKSDYKVEVDLLDFGVRIQVKITLIRLMAWSDKVVDNKGKTIMEERTWPQFIGKPFLTADGAFEKRILHSTIEMGDIKRFDGKWTLFETDILDGRLRLCLHNVISATEPGIDVNKNEVICTERGLQQLSPGVLRANEILSQQNLPYRALRETEGRGNCFFHALLDQLLDRTIWVTLSKRGREVPLNHVELRKAIVKYMRELGDELSNSHQIQAWLLLEEADESKKPIWERRDRRKIWQDHLKVMETVGQDAYETVILGAAQFFDKDILVINETSSYPMCCKNPKWPQMAIVHLSRVHFQSVHRVQSIDAITYKQNKALSGPSIPHPHTPAVQIKSSKKVNT